MYSGLISKPTNFIPNFFAATHSEPDPTNGTRTSPSFSGFADLISFSERCNTPAIWSEALSSAVFSPAAS